MNYKGQPSNRIISRKFVETTVIILFVLNLIATIALLITGIIYNTQDTTRLCITTYLQFAYSLGAVSSFPF